MARRPAPTLADYMAIAISPALIMGLVGSLAFFLLDLTYHGQYGDRLHWIMSWFVMAIVLIARIAIKEGGERASLFGLALAGAMLLAVFYLVPEYVVLAPFLLALAWWCAHELTWNCTWIDEDEDPGGEGLLQAAGLERTEGPAEETAAPPTPEEPRRARPWWRRLAQTKRRHARAPGTTVVWFSLAALPIFGFGQLAIPAEDTAGRRYAFWLATIYVGCGLGLLLNTAFLGLRRYLRRRGLEMPVSISGGWLTLGGLMIAGLLLAGALLPRPSAEYSLAQVAVNAGKQVLEASRFAPLSGSAGEGQGVGGGEGPHRPAQAGSSPGADESGGAGETGSAGDGSESSSAKSDARNSSGKPDQGASGQASGQAKSGQSAESGGSAGKAGSGESSANRSNSGHESEQGGDSSKGASGAGHRSQGKSAADGSDPDAAGQRDSKGSPIGQKASRGGGSESARSGSATPSERSQPSAAARPPVEPLQPVADAARTASSVLQGVRSLAGLLKWLLVAAAVGFFLWQFGPELARLWNALAAWLRGLFGGKNREDEPEEALPEEAAQRRLSFSLFANPFASGLADRASPEQLVVYTFAALEAWGREAGLERSPDQTPLEYATGLQERFPPLEPAAGQTAELYTYLAYGAGRLTPQVSGPLEALWQRLASTRAGGVGGIRAAVPTSRT